jgi:hypothetical protein
VYGATTVAAIATAEVSIETIYLSVGGKASLVRYLVEPRCRAQMSRSLPNTAKGWRKSVPSPIHAASSAFSLARYVRRWNV